MYKKYNLFWTCINPHTAVSGICVYIYIHNYSKTITLYFQSHMHVSWKFFTKL